MRNFVFFDKIFCPWRPDRGQVAKLMDNDVLFSPLAICNFVTSIKGSYYEIWKAVDNYEHQSVGDTTAQLMTMQLDREN